MNFHILTMDEKLKTANVIFHIPIPATGTNQAEISWQDAVVRELGGADNINSKLPDISIEEETDLKAGVLFEKQMFVRFSSTDLTNAERLAEIKAKFAEIQTTLIAEQQITLNWIGFQGNV